MSFALFLTLRYNYFGFKTLARSYLLRTGGEITERPQDMLMRVAVGIHYSDIDRAIQSYNFMSSGWLVPFYFFILFYLRVGAGAGDKEGERWTST